MLVSSDSGTAPAVAPSSAAPEQKTPIPTENAVSDRAAEIAGHLDALPERAQTALLEGFKAWVETRAKGGTWQEAGRAMDAVFARHPDLPALHGAGAQLAAATGPDQTEKQTEDRPNA